MRVLELFSGTGTLSGVAASRGHETFTVDLNEPADLQADVVQLSGEDLLDATGWDHVDMLWASPICTGFSVAAVGKCWTMIDGVPHPKSDSARESLALLEATVRIVQELRPSTWYIENPRGMARKMSVVQGLQRATITQCQYGDHRMKPTDIWFESPHWSPRPPCGNGDPCHEAAPRGSRTGTQGVKGALERARLPVELCLEVIQASEASVKHRESLAEA